MGPSLGSHETESNVVPLPHVAWTPGNSAVDFRVSSTASPTSLEVESMGPSVPMAAALDLGASALLRTL